LLNGSGISVSSLGSGVGGNIAIVADNLTLSNGSYITSETKSNNGGNLNLDVSSILLLRYGSGISTTAGFADAGGNGGDITINAGFIVGVPIENSDITANAFTGNGGKVTIFTNGIYGLQYRSQRTPLSDITASSKYGVQGTVNINTPDADPSKGLSNLPANVSDPSRLVKERCSADRRGSEFIITGKGGVPANPSDRPTDTGVLDNFGTLPDRHQTANRTSSATPQPTTTPDRTPDRIVEATGWIVNAQNQVVLVAGTTPAQHNIPCPR
jgi:large exoprotein involved in heme utilization and adhesion